MNNESVLSNIERLQRKLYGILEDLSNSLESKADFIILWLYDSESDEFGLPIRYGIQPNISEAELVLRPGTHIGGELIVDKKEPVIIDENIRNSVMDGEFVRRHKILSSAGFPLIYSDQVIGVLFVSYCSMHTFVEDEQKIITEATEKASSIIVTANVFAELRSLIPGKCSLTAGRPMGGDRRLTDQVSERRHHLQTRYLGC